MVRIAVTEPVHPEALAMLAGHDVAYAPALTAPAFEAALAGAEAVLVRIRRLDAPAPGWRIVSKHGAGVDNIALPAMRAAGVTVTNTPGANAAAVAEQTLMLMLALARDLDGQRAGRTGPRPGLEGRRLTVVGHGATGARVARLGLAFGMRVTVVAPRLAAPPEGCRLATLAAALPETDVLTLHCPLTPATAGMVGAAELAALPAGALVVNTARGGIVDEDALAAALVAGHLGGAALDVTAVEPLPAAAALRRAPRLIVTPHAAALSDGAFRRMGLEAARNVLDFLGGTLRPGVVVA